MNENIKGLSIAALVVVVSISLLATCNKPSKSENVTPEQQDLKEQITAKNQDAHKKEETTVTIRGKTLNLFEATIEAFGEPDKITSTEYDNPRPPFVTKILEYDNEHIRFIFLAGEPIGTPPPYKIWHQLAVLDTRDESVISPEEMEQRMLNRAINHSREIKEGNK